jgi:hypothetical protein
MSELDKIKKQLTFGLFVLFVIAAIIAIYNL